MLNQVQLALDSAHVERARELAGQAVDGLAERVGTSDPRYGHALGVLGAIEVHGGQRAVGLQHLVEAHQVLRAAHGPEHPSLLGPLSDLAGEYLRIGARRTGLSFARQALAAAHAVNPDGHPGLAPHLLVLGRGEALDGNTDEALRLVRAAVAVTPTSPVNRRLLVWLLAALGDRAAALAVIREMAVLEDAELPGVLAAASETHRRAFLGRLWETVETLLTVALATDDADLAGETWDLVSRRRGINAEHLRRERRTACGSGRSGLQELLRELADVRAELARAVYGDDAGSARRLAARREELEQLIAAQVAPTVDTWTAVGRTVPANAVYVEYVRSTVVDAANLAFGHAPEGSPAERFDPRPRHRYVAFVVIDDGSDTGVDVHMVDLGDSAPIDDLVVRFRAELIARGAGAADPARTWRCDELGTALRKRLLDPLSLPTGRDRLLVVTDGAVGLLPLQILPARDGRLLVDHLTIIYLESAWDLGRRYEPSRYHQPGPPLIVADPDFDLGSDGGPSDGFAAPRLPGTRGEGEVLGELLTTTPFLGAEAVKMVVEESRSPRLVHLATHGLFLAEPDPPPPDDHYGAVHVVEVPGEGSFLVQLDPRTPPDAPSTPGLPGTDSDPLLRSAVVLAGFNAWIAGVNPPAEAGNGLLTADEVCSLDLRRTALVVLSACETGLGDPRPTEGLVGLRWAFSVAGARSVVTSLWSIPDRATRELMIEFYTRLLDGMPVSDALRAAQLALRRRHPVSTDLEFCPWMVL